MDLTANSCADCVLMVFTHVYRRRFFGGNEEHGRSLGRRERARRSSTVRRATVLPQGRGVMWQGPIITNMLYAAESGHPRRSIPVAFSPAAFATIPNDVFS